MLKVEKKKKNVFFNANIEFVYVGYGHKILNYNNSQTKYEFNNALNESIIEKKNNLNVGDIDLYYEKKKDVNILHKFANYQSKNNILRFI